jgi:hypothetical protein
MNAIVGRYVSGYPTFEESGDYAVETGLPGRLAYSESWNFSAEDEI